MVRCQFQALRAETERLRAADVAAALRKKEEAKHGAYDGLSIKHWGGYPSKMKAYVASIGGFGGTADADKPRPVSKSVIFCKQSPGCKEKKSLFDLFWDGCTVQQRITLRLKVENGFCFGSGSRLRKVNQSQHTFMFGPSTDSFICHFNSIPLVLWEELQHVAEDPSVEL